MNMKWNTTEKLKNLLFELVSWESETLTEGEQEFSRKLVSKLHELSYFQHHPEYLQVSEVDYDRQVVSALYKQEGIRDTVVLISHFDTVQFDEYGSFKPLATKPEELTNAFLANPNLLNETARKDLQSGDYLFGRGVMDMKMGLSLHMQLLERAIEEEWPINLLLLTVPDEEVNSAGMRQAVKHLATMKEAKDLNIVLFLNSEPSFTQDPEDTSEYIYSGTIGKIMPAALFYGKETHVGEPFKGMTAAFMSAFLTTEMEWSEKFKEEQFGETTPLPVSLQLKDLKDRYSTQTPYRAVSLYNVFLLKRSAEEIMTIFEDVATTAMAKCQERYEEVCARHGAKAVGKIRVIRFEDLQKYALEKLGQQSVNDIINSVIINNCLDDREKSLKIADQLMINCQELAPATVLLFAPPYYPPANSSDDPLVKGAISILLDEAKKYDIPLEQIHYFNGICDLSYCQSNETKDWQSYERNTPVWGKTYDIPFKDIAKIGAPVLNVGPFGKDPHQISERLHIKSGLEEMPELLYKLLQYVMTQRKETKI
ncbi:M20/M25/M40 family metallo-hydrolase [Ureibacillus composti]